MKEILLNLLRFQTTSDRNAELHKAIDYVESLFNDYDVHVKRYVQNSKPSIVITTKFTKEPNIFLNGHLDVVEGLSDQFEPREEGSRIYARGTSDMKGPVAAMIQAFIELIKSGNKDLDIGLMLTTDEEMGGNDGSSYLLKEKGYGSEIAFIPDGGRGDWSICTNEKGVMFYNIEVKGKSAHGSRMWLGESANWKLIEILSELREQFIKDFGHADALDTWKPSLNIGKFNGGTTQNSVSDLAKAYLDIRFTEKNTVREMKEYFDKFVSKFENVVGEMTVYGDATNIDSDNPYLIKWADLYSASFQKEPIYYKTHGGSDGRFFAEKGIPTLIVKSTASEMHIEDEWIDFEELVKFKEMIKKWIQNSQ